MTDLKLFATPARIKALKELIDSKKISRVLLEGLSGSAPAMLLAGLPRAAKPYVIVADDADAAGYVYHDLSKIIDPSEIVFLPSGFKRALKYGQVDPPAEIMRTEAIEAFFNNKKTKFLVTYPEALAERVPKKDTLSENTLTITLKTKINQSDVVKKLRELGFRDADYVYEPGQFARRGSIVDVYSFSNELPYRIDFFDDEIDSIRTFDVETQLSEEKLDRISIIAAGAEMNTSGVSFPEYAGDDTVYFMQGLPLCLERVKGITEEKFSASAMIADEGDPEVMKQAVDYDRFREAL